MQRIIILLYISTAFSNKIIDLKDKKYVMIETDSAYVYQDTTFLYHVANLSKILSPYEKLVRSVYNFEQDSAESIMINKIENLKSQLLPNMFRTKRSLNFLGSALKIITGTPDHDDLIEIKTGLNMLIENNNKQKKINSAFEKMLENISPESISEHLILTEVYNELSSIATMINLAKNGNFYSGTLNLKDIEQIVSNEALDLPIINILEYANINVCYYNYAIITIYKYPILKTKCKLFNLYPLAYKHGKLLLDSKIAKCNEEFTSVEKCKNYLGNFICKIKNADNCTINILKNIPAKCEVIHENNTPLQILENGNIITDYEHTWNNIKINGPKLIQFNYSTTIDGKEYFNHQQELKDVIHNQHNEQLEVLRILKSNGNYKFSNIQEISTFLIPIKEHPIQFTLYSILGLCTLALITYCLSKICECYKIKKREAKTKRMNDMYETELLRLRQTQSIV